MAPPETPAGTLEGVEATPRPLARNLVRSRHPRLAGPQVGLLRPGSLARRGLGHPCPALPDRILAEPRSGWIPRSLPSASGCSANRRMRTRMSGGVGGAGVSPAPTRLLAFLSLL